MPLAIVTDASVGMISSFKETWTLDHAKITLERESVYEAGGSMFWANPLPSHCAQLPYQDLSFAEAQILAELMLQPSEMSGGRQRILPQLLECYQNANVILEPNAYPKKLNLLSGHGYVCAWWIAIYEAVIAEDEPKLKMLIEAALCTTIRLRILDKQGEVAAASIYASNIITAFSLHADTFRVFAWKVILIIKEQSIAQGGKKESQALILSRLVNQYPELAYNGTKMHKTMLGAIIAFNSLFPQDSEAGKRIELIDRKHGRDILGSYDRNYKLANVLNSMITECKQLEPDYAVAIIELLLRDLDRGKLTGELKPEDINDKYLFGTEVKNSDKVLKKVGWVTLRTAALEIIRGLKGTAEHAKVSAFCMECLCIFPETFDRSRLSFSEATCKLLWTRIVLVASQVGKSTTAAFNNKRIQT